MKFIIEFDGVNLTMEADDAVKAITRLIDSGISIPDNAEFKIIAVSSGKRGTT